MNRQALVAEILRAGAMLLFLGPGACSSPATTASCSDAQTQPCTGHDGCPGQRSCVEGDWGSCDCDDSDAAVGGQAGAAGSLARLGAACERDTDCPAGAFCLLPDGGSLFGGGPASGVCTADCTADARTCEGFESAVCVDTSAPSTSPGNSALCLESCDFGSAGDQSKCHGRDDVACELLSSGEAGFCRPVCTVDSDCGTLGCDRRQGVCRDASLVVANTGFAATCNPEAAEPGCSGLCLELADDFAACSHRCVFGTSFDCAQSSGEQPAACVFVSPGASLGDIGFCAELCDCNDECTSETFVCRPFDDETLETVFGYLGACGAATDSGGASVEGIPCP